MKLTKHQIRNLNTLNTMTNFVILRIAQVSNPFFYGLTAIDEVLSTYVGGTCATSVVCQAFFMS